MGVLTVDQIADHLRVSRWTVGLSIAERDLAASKQGVFVRVAVDDYLDFLRRHIVPATSDLGSSQTMSLDISSSLADLPDLVPYTEVAAMIRRSPKALKLDLRARRYEHIHTGNQYLFTPAQVKALIAADTVAPAPVVDPLEATRTRVARQRARRKNPTTAGRAA